MRLPALDCGRIGVLGSAIFDHPTFRDQQLGLVGRQIERVSDLESRNINAIHHGGELSHQNHVHDADSRAIFNVETATGAPPVRASP
jgi:hypothetical protein